MNMCSSEEDVEMVNEVMSPYSTEVVGHRTSLKEGVLSNNTDSTQRSGVLFPIHKDLKDTMSDTSSVLSVLPSEMDLDDDMYSGSTSETDMSIAIPSLESYYSLKSSTAVSNFEKMPHEVVLRIAALLPSDSDLIHLVLTCHTFARQILPENSGVWKTRFLQKYDYPIIAGLDEFRIAYQLRALLLPRFAYLSFERRHNATILCTVLKDMVLETYNNPHSWKPSLRSSSNIAAFSDRGRSKWMVYFLSTRLFACDRKSRNGGCPPLQLFDTLQVLFSYLDLNRNMIAVQVGCEREDYDLGKVYMWDREFELLYTQSPAKPQKRVRSTLRLRSSAPARDKAPSKMSFNLDMNSLLHIRNFWHRHLTEPTPIGRQETYVGMATGLAEAGIAPKAWTQPLQEPSQLQMKWYGHYSCVYPLPRATWQFKRKETEAEFWDTVDPLHLDIATHHDGDAAWPPIFSIIPAFASTFPAANGSLDPGAVFIRGLAPFQAVAHIRNPPPQHKLSLQYHHPFTRLRLRGFVHPIEDQEGIPGWQRAVFVLYKPTYRFLCEIFEHATEHFGQPFQQQFNDVGTAAAALTTEETAPITYEELEAQYKVYLEHRLRRLKGPVTMSRALIEKIDDAYADPVALSWDDIEFAYAYEGIMTPGGKVMLGRWWRVGPEGPEGVGPGQEYTYEGALYPTERGPFVFWSAD